MCSYTNVILFKLMFLCGFMKGGIVFPHVTLTKPPLTPDYELLEPTYTLKQ